jgi:RNA polymerase sigma factor (sigma-70 family)
VRDDLDELYRQHAVPVWRFVRARVPDNGEAEDVTSEVFVRAVRSHDRFDPAKGSEGAWLIGIARHAVADWWRTRRPRTAELDTATDRYPDPAEGPEDAALRGADAGPVRAALAALSDREQEAIALRFGAGLRPGEVGAALEISEAAAKMLVYRAVTKLRRVMNAEVTDDE